MSAPWDEFLLPVLDAETRAFAIRVIVGLDLSNSWDVLVRPKRRRRTLRQNRRYFSTVQFAAEHSGYSVSELHDLCKAHVLGLEVVTLGDTVIERPRSTRGLSTAQFADFAQRSEAWLVSELQLRLPAWG